MGALRERNFRLLFTGQAISALGNTLVPVALAFAVLDLTHSASDLGYVLGAGSAATVMFILLGGVIADRVSRRTLMVAADSVRCGAQLTLGILLVAGRPAMATIIVLTAIAGMAAALFSPASTGLTPALVPAEHLQQANALQQTSAAAAGVAGPAVAGLLVVSVGAGWAIIADALTFAVSVGLLSVLRIEQIPRSANRHWLTDLRAGWTDFWSRDWFRTVVLGASAVNFLFASYAVLGPAASKEYYHGAATWATIATAMAIGAVAGGLVALRFRPRYPLRAAVLLCLPAGVPPLAIAGLLPVAAVAATAALCGAGLIVFESLWQTSVQRLIPADRLSRASSYDYFGSLIAYPVGLAVAGPIAAAAGVRPVMLSVGCISIVIIACMLLVPSVRNLTGAAYPAASSTDAAASGTRTC